MHEHYEEYDDDEYDDDHYNYDYGDQYDPYKFYFKFDVAGTPLSDWITDMIDNIFKDPIDKIDESFNITNINISDFPIVSFPVNSWNSNTAKDSSFQYLGSNYHNSPIWKKKYFASDPINIEYKLHLQANAKYFVKQPTYYKGLFDILN